jgi:hypothetical protein
VKRKWIIAGIVIATIAIALIVASRQTKPVVTFSSVERQSVQSTIGSTTLKVAFYVTNTASGWVILQVAAFETNNGTAWIADTEVLAAKTFRTLGRIGPQEVKRLSVAFDVSREPVRTRLRVLVSQEATSLQKGQLALRRFWANVRGQGKFKEFWVGNLGVPAYEVVTPEIP